MSITECARLRMVNIAGYHGGQVKKMAVRAWNLGIRRKYTNGSLRAFLDKMYLNYHAETELRVYRDCVYMFLFGELIDVEHLPKRLNNW